MSKLITVNELIVALSEIQSKGFGDFNISVCDGFISNPFTTFIKEKKVQIVVYFPVKGTKQDTKERKR